MRNWKVIVKFMVFVLKTCLGPCSGSKCWFPILGPTCWRHGQCHLLLTVREGRFGIFSKIGFQILVGFDFGFSDAMFTHNSKVSLGITRPRGGIYARLPCLSVEESGTGLAALQLCSYRDVELWTSKY